MDAQKGADPCIVYVSGLTERMLERHLDEIFGFYGRIERLQLHESPRRAVIEYNSPAHAHRAVSHMDRGEIDGARVTVSLDDPTMYG